MKKLILLILLASCNSKKTDFVELYRFRKLYLQYGNNKVPLPSDTLIVRLQNSKKVNGAIKSIRRYKAFFYGSENINDTLEILIHSDLHYFSIGKESFRSEFILLDSGILQQLLTKTKIE